MRGGSPVGRRRRWSGCSNTPPLYTAGTSAKTGDLVEPDRFPVHATGRGGQYTYHGPGQRVAYVMLDLNRRRPDLRAYVSALEAWIIATLAAFNVRGERREDRVGVWVRRPDKGEGVEDKIAAIGIRVRRWVSFHGISLNVEPRPVAFLRNRALRHLRTRGDQPRRSRPDRHPARTGHGVARGVRRHFRRNTGRMRAGAGRIWRCVIASARKSRPINLNYISILHVYLEGTNLNK